MKPTLLSEALGVSTMTLRRWSRMYDKFLTPAAAPEAGEARFYQQHDQRVLLLVKKLRDNNLKPEEIMVRLEDEKQRDYATLPPLPIEWEGNPDDMIPSVLAGARASELVSIAALQTQVQNLTARLEEATQRTERLEAELHTVRTEKGASDERARALELSLAEAQGDVKQAVASLEAYRLAYSFGRDRPVNIGLIIVAALAVGAVLVFLAFIVSSLIL